MAEFSERLFVIVPVYNEQESVEELLKSLSDVCSQEALKTSVILVDDCSDRRVNVNTELLNGIESVRSVRLLRNVGHQQAIAVGISYVSQTFGLNNIVVIDGDGEDNPTDIPRLIRASVYGGAPPPIVFATRRSRHNDLIFMFLYRCYQALFLILTGKRIEFGNFSFIPKEFSEKVTALPDIWNHYSAALLKSRLKILKIPCHRRARINGQTKMSFTTLILHGLSSLSVFSEVIGARMIICCVISAIIGITVGISAIVIRCFTDLAIPGWTTLMVGISLIVTLQCLGLILIFTFITLSLRRIPWPTYSRSYSEFVADVQDM